jgi:DNA-damage-inducible protein D
MSDLRKIDDLIDPNGNHMIVEEIRRENGNIYWLASELMRVLGYGDDMKSFSKAIRRATKTLNVLNVDIFSHISKTVLGTEKGVPDDYMLTRFGAYLVTMNADPRKPEVAKAQAYFIAMTRQFEMWLEQPDDFARVAIREEIKGENTTLAGIAKSAGVENYAKFQNAGYLGMYNMINVQLAQRRGLDKEKLIDHMGRVEMAANLFRITMTEERIKSQNIHGQENLEAAHRTVGRGVRAMVQEQTGKNPEDLPVERHLPDLHGQLKIGHRKMKEINGDHPVKKASKRSKKRNVEQNSDGEN